MTKTREALCHCGQISLVCKGEPFLMAMCHCSLCQRRTGTSYNLGAWFNLADVEISGETNTYFRDNGDTGMELTYHFCPNCGSNIYWTVSARPDEAGVAVGCFADKDFPAPTITYYGKDRHEWLAQPSGAPVYVGGIGSELEQGQ